jgi:hypothetical protein
LHLFSLWVTIYFGECGPANTCFVILACLDSRVVMISKVIILSKMAFGVEQGRELFHWCGSDQSDQATNRSPLREQRWGGMSRLFGDLWLCFLSGIIIALLDVRPAHRRNSSQNLVLPFCPYCQSWHALKDHRADSRAHARILQCREGKQENLPESFQVAL